MLAFILLVPLTFFQDYQHFVDTKKADQLLVAFAQDTTDLTLLENDPVKIWFIRSHFPSPQIESLLVSTRPLPRQPEIAAALRWEGLKSQDSDLKLKRYIQAGILDPYAFDGYLSLLALGLERGDRIMIKKTLAALPDLGKDFQIQVLVSTNLLLLFYSSLVALCFMFVFIQLFKYFPLLAHRFGFASHSLKELIGAIIVLSPLVLFFNIYILFYCYGLALLFVLRERSRRWLRLVFLLILISVPISYPITKLAGFLQRRAKTYELYSYLKITYAEPKLRFTEAEELFILAYSLKKQKLFEGSRALYENLAQTQTNNYAILNNLANLYSMMKAFAQGESLYRKAIALDGGRGEAHFNLGWCYLKELKFYEASQEIETAKRLDFKPPVEGYYDIPPGESFFWNSLFAEKPRLVLLFKLKFVLPALLLFLLSFIIKPFDEPTACSLCGRAICGKCQQLVGEDIYCNDCWAKLSKTRNEKYEQSIVDVFGRRLRRWEKFKMLLLTALLPGMGHYYQGRVLAGSLLAIGPLACYLLFAFRSVIIKPPFWVPVSLDGLMRLAAIPLIAICYIIAFLSLRSRDVA